MSKRLDAMRRNPYGDWTITDIAALCRELGIVCEPARSGGSHYKIAHPRMAAKLTVPFKRPIKAVYVKQLVAFAEAVRNLP